MISNTLIRGIDLTKFLMAITIVNIHSELYKILGTFLLTFQSCAVPVFFVFSSYFFFKKIRELSGKEVWKRLWNYEKRINTLYIFWIIVQSPIIVFYYHKEYLELPILYAIGSFIKNYFFAYEFGASWFLGALIVGIPIILFLVRSFDDRISWVLPFIIYVYICKFPDGYLFKSYEANLRTPQLSFPYALWWLILGHLLSNESVVKYIKNVNIYTSLTILTISLLISYLFKNLQFLFCIISVITIFSISINLKLKDYPKLYSRFRTYSIHFYCIHYSLIVIINYCLSDNILLTFISTITICWIISEIIIFLQQKPIFNWLRYSS